IGRSSAQPVIKTQEAVGLAEHRRLQIARSGPFFTVFLPHSRSMGQQIRQKLSSPGPVFAFDAKSPMVSWPRCIQPERRINEPLEARLAATPTASSTRPRDAVSAGAIHQPQM